MLKKVLFLLFVIILTTQWAYTKENNVNPAKKIMDNLYMAGTLGKINDMVVDMEFFGPAPGKQEAKNVMESFGTAKLFFTAPNKIRTEKKITIPGAQADIYTITIRDGRLDWKFGPYSPWPLSKREDDHHHSIYLPFSIDTQPQDQFRNFTMVGKEKVGDRDAYVISISNEKDPLAKLITIWVDIERYIPLKEEYTVTEGEKDKVKEVNKTIMYKDVTQMDDGRWMPHKIETYASGKMTTYIIYRQSAINVGLPPNLFAPDDPSLAPR